MSYGRRMTRPDSTQKLIVDALRQAGVLVYVIGQPADLLCFYRGTWTVLECKPEDYKGPRADQQEQTDFLAATGTPVVRTIFEAFEAMGLWGDAV